MRTMPKGMRLHGEVSKLFDKCERSSRDFARTLKHPEWNEFMKRAEIPAPTYCPVKGCYLRDAGLDMIVCHLARHHLWEPDAIAFWLEENFC